MKPLKPFDLERFKAGDVAIARNGSEAHFVGFTDKVKSNQQLIARMDGYIYLLDNRGYGLERGSDFDLIGMKPTNKKGWIAIYPESGVETIGASNVYPSKERLLSVTMNGINRIIVEIEYEE